MNEIKLKKCPFCSGDAADMSAYSKKQRGYFTFVKCTLCGSQSKSFYSKEQDDSKTLLAVMAWNNRRPTEED